MIIIRIISEEKSAVESTAPWRSSSWRKPLRTERELPAASSKGQILEMHGARGKICR
jgi:hypothetical protein